MKKIEKVQTEQIPHTYEELRAYMKQRLQKEFGTIIAFIKSSKMQELNYTPRTGVLTEQNASTYISNHNFKFMKAVYEMWGIEINQQQLVQKQTIHTANIKVDVADIKD